MGIITEEIFAAILDTMREGNGIRRACKINGVSPSTFWSHCSKERAPDLFERYTAARVASWDAMAEQIIEIADTPIEATTRTTKETQHGTFEEVKVGDNVARSHLSVESRKWLLARMRPKKYGHKADESADRSKEPTEIVRRVIG